MQTLGRQHCCWHTPRPICFRSSAPGGLPAVLSRSTQQCRAQGEGTATKESPDPSKRPYTESQYNMPGTPVDGFTYKRGIRPDADRLYPATDDVPMDFYDASCIADPDMRRKALDDLLVPLGHGPATDVKELPLHGMRKNDYTPFEFLNFTDEEIVHHLTEKVDAPISKVYAIWEDRRNWAEWFDLISQSVYHREDHSIISLFLFYRWGQLPTMELYVTLKREDSHRDSYIIEKTLEGFPMAAAVFFRESEDGGTEVNLRIAYALAAQLKEFVGPVGVFGDVNDILAENMAQMKEFCEQTDLAQLQTLRRDEDIKMNDHIKVREQEIARAYQEFFLEAEQELDAEEAAEEAAMQRKDAPTTEPNATATSAVADTERYPDIQGTSEFSPTEANPTRGFEGGGQEAEASSARYTTPRGIQKSSIASTDSPSSRRPPESSTSSTQRSPASPGIQTPASGRVGDVRREDPWAGGPPSPSKAADRQDAAATVSPGDAGAGQETDAPTAQAATPKGVVKPKISLEPQEQVRFTPAPKPKRAGRPRKAKAGEEATQKDPGGGNEGGSSAAAQATPSGIVEGKPKAKRGGRRSQKSEMMPIGLEGPDCFAADTSMLMALSSHLPGDYL